MRFLRGISTIIRRSLAVAWCSGWLPGWCSGWYMPGWCSVRYMPGRFDAVLAVRFVKVGNCHARCLFTRDQWEIVHWNKSKKRAVGMFFLFSAGFSSSSFGNANRPVRYPTTMWYIHAIKPPTAIFLLTKSCAFSSL